MIDLLSVISDVVINNSYFNIAALLNKILEQALYKSE